MEEVPDTWQVVKLTNRENGNIHHRLMCGWFGGYLNGDSWRMSSGIERIIDQDTHWHIPQTSGSVYICHKNNNRLGGYASSVLARIIETAVDVDIECITIEEILEQYKYERQSV